MSKATLKKLLCISACTNTLFKVIFVESMIFFEQIILLPTENIE